VSRTLATPHTISHSQQRYATVTTTPHTATNHPILPLSKGQWHRPRTQRLARSLLSWHAIVPFTFRIQVKPSDHHQTQGPPFESFPAAPGIQQGASRRSAHAAGRAGRALVPRSVTLPARRGRADLPRGGRNPRLPGRSPRAGACPGADVPPCRRDQSIGDTGPWMRAPSAASRAS